MNQKCRVAALMGNGHIDLVERELPPVTTGTVLVDVHRSLVSPGTELNGWGALRRQLESPEPNASPRPFGYANAGVVVEVGQGVTRLRPGDRVSCIGAGFALHADRVVVPHHLCTPLPHNVTFSQGSYAMLAATAMQAVRRGRPELGEYVAVAGMGLVGQLTARLYQLAGNYVMGWDTNPFMLERARHWDIDAVAHVGNDDVQALTQRFTGGIGLDAAVIAFGGNADSTYENLMNSLKCTSDGHRMGRIIVVGGASFHAKWRPANADIRFAARTGPGYHDSDWETGDDYPPVWMRWTTRSNLELCLRLIGEKKLDVDCLTTHTAPLSNLDESVQSFLEHPHRVLGVVFDMKS